jgi:hypothetical protein
VGLFQSLGDLLEALVDRGTFRSLRALGQASLGDGGADPWTERRPPQHSHGCAGTGQQFNLKGDVLDSYKRIPLFPEETAWLHSLRPGDPVVRWLAGEIPLNQTLTAIDGGLITCGLWTFDHTTGAEMDQDLVGDLFHRQLYPAFGAMTRALCAIRYLPPDWSSAGFDEPNVQGLSPSGTGPVWSVRLVKGGDHGRQAD